MVGGDAAAAGEKKRGRERSLFVNRPRGVERERATENALFLERERRKNQRKCERQGAEA